VDILRVLSHRAFDVIAINRDAALRTAADRRDAPEASEIDEVVLMHPQVADAGAVGVPDSLRGEKVVLFVVLKEGMQASQDELLAYCREHLAKYKVPKKIIFKNELPKTAVGKVLRRTLRDEAMLS